MEKLKVLEEMYVLFSESTHMPFVKCDENTFNDQVFVFSREEFAQKESQKLTEQKRPVRILKFTKEQFLPFYINLYPIGANAIVIDYGVNALEIQLEELCRKPDFTNVPKENVPIINPELHLTALYFMQELRRPMAPEEKPQIQELQEEVIVNLRRGTYLVPLQFTGEEEDTQMLTKDNKNVMIPYVKYENGDSYQPVFTDPNEFHKFNKDKNFKAIAMPFENLHRIVGDESKGVVINPIGFNMILNRAQLEQ